MSVAKLRGRRPSTKSRVLMLGLALTFALSGCASTMQAQRAAQIRERMAAAKAEMAACVEKRKAGIFRTHVESATCVNDAQQRAFSDIGYPYMDLVSSLSAARLRIAAQVDAGQITEAEAQARMMDAVAQVQNEERRRREEAAVENAAIRANNAAAAAAYGNMIATGVGMMTGGR
jgi:hypothetical protein